MIGKSPIRNKSELTFYQKPELYKKLEKSYTRTEGIQRTPSIQNINPYLNHIETRSTDKKKASHNVTYQAPILMEQNKTLLAQNRQMALLIHDRNLQIEALEKKYEEKIEGQEQLFREIQAQKQRFVGEVIRHKELTDQQIVALQEKIRDLEDQKVEIQKQWNRNYLNQQAKTERQTRNQFQKMSAQYQESMSLLQAEKMKLKSDLEQKGNELQRQQMENKHKLEGLRYEVEKAKEEAKHSDHLRKLETAEMKHFYQSKIQQMHLDNRREKQLFLVQHSTEIKKLEEELSKRKREKELLEEQIEHREKEIGNMFLQQMNQKSRMLQQVQAEKQITKQRMTTDKEMMNSVFEAQQQMLQNANQEQINALFQQNNKLTNIIQVKTEEIKRLYSEIESLRGRYCAELQENQKMISDLLSKMYTSEIGNQEDKELLKTKLAVLRETDLKTLRGYYDNQIKVLNDQLQQKDALILANRSRLQEELRRKDELRKRYQLQFSKQKEQIKELNSKIQLLEVSLKMESKEEAVKMLQMQTTKAKELKIQEKMENIRQEELVHLQTIIIAKDLQIQQLEQKLELFKSNQVTELQQKDNLLFHIRKEHQASLQGKNKTITALQSQILKLKDELKKEKLQYQQQKKILDQKWGEQLQEANQQLNLAKAKHDLQISTFKNQIRTLTLQVTKLQNELKNSLKERESITSDLQNDHIVNSNREKEMLEEFYTGQIRLKEEEIIDLRERNTELSNDIMDARENYANLQKKLQSLIESQSSLREIQRKVMNLGKENNLLKNKKEVSSRQ